MLVAGNRCMVIVSLIAAVAASTAQAENWPQFRGPDRDAVSKETGLLRKWPDGGPKVRWRTEACEGYAAPTVYDGRVYFNDYDRDGRVWLVRCLSLANGKELWRYEDKKRIRPNHGITRTMPAVDGKYVFSLDPKCVFHCLDAETGRELWSKNFVREYGTTIPPWYAGQCPLIEPDRVLIAPAGKSLVLALDRASGDPIWETPNPESWTMSHSSLMPAEIGGVKQYLYCTLNGVVGVSAADGALLWHFPWKFNIAVPTSPLHVGGGRIFLTSCYEARTVMIQVKRNSDTFSAEEVFSFEENAWNSETHTPIVYRDHLYAVGKKRRGLFTCLDLNGQTVWDSRDHASFGLGSYILADGMFFILEGKTGTLRLLDANAKEYGELDSAKVLNGPDVWAPLALADGALLVRDMTQLVCLEVAATKSGDATPAP